MPTSNVWELPERYRRLDATYDEALEMLAATRRLGISPMLETVIDMLDELGRPDGAYRIVQIAGTNGKTSTSRYAAAILAGEGYRTALYTSPELVSMTERMEVDGEPVSERAFAHGVACAVRAGERVNGARREAGERPYDITEFDLLTVAALVVYAEAGVDVAVLEVGMGGRWDATSATRPELTCVTGIGLDHMQVLGDTLEAIAAEKAAVVKRGQRACILGPGCLAVPSVRAVLDGRARSQRVSVTNVIPDAWEDDPGADYGRHAAFTVDHDPAFLGDRLVLGVTTPHWPYVRLCAQKPAYQAQNIACAVALCEAFCGRPLDEERLAESVARCPTPGRFDIVSAEPLHLVDACHNPQSVETFLASFEPLAPTIGERPALLCACLADKDARGMTALLAREFDEIYVTRTASSRALSVRELAERFRAAGAEPAGIFDSVPEACEALDSSPYVALGTITLAGEVTHWHRFH